jgi:HK97 family phage portal protein
VLAIVRRISTDMANMPIEIQKKIGKNDWIIDYDHDLNQVFERPNERNTGHEFIEHLVLSYLVPGNGFAAIISDHGDDPKKVGLVQELIPLLPGYTTVREEFDGKLKYRTNCKMLVNKRTLDPVRNGPARWLTADEIIHIKFLSIDNGITGTAPITLMVDTIGLDLSYQKMQSRLVRNGALFQFALQLPGKPNDVQIINSQANLKQQVSGIQNAGAPPIISGGANILKTSMTPVEMQLNEAMLANAVKLAQGWGIPGSVIGFNNATGYANYEIEMKSYVDRTLMTIANAIESAFEHKLLKKEERGKVRIRFNFDELLRATMTERVDMGVKLVTNGIITPNEYRKSEQLVEVPWGNTPRVPTNQGILGQDGMPIAVQDPKTDETIAATNDGIKQGDVAKPQEDEPGEA